MKCRSHTLACCRILSLLIAPSVFAGDSFSLHLDLSGPWKMQEGDDPGYAQPGWDDTKWKSVGLPVGKQETAIFMRYWLRRSVALPQGVDDSRLVLTLGTIRSAFELYINGRRVGESGGFADYRARPLQQPHQFELPPGILPAGQTAVIALRVTVDDLAPPPWRIDDNGPYLLTNREQAPVDPAGAQFGRRFVMYSPFLVLATLLAGIGALSLLGWLGDRSRWELLWFALSSLCGAMYSLETIASLHPDTRPFGRWGGPSTQLIWTSLSVPLLGLSVLTLLSRGRSPIRQVSLGVVLAIGAALILSFPLTPGSAPTVSMRRHYWGEVVCSGVIFTAVVLDWWRTRRSALHWEEHALRATILLYSLSTAEDWGRRLLQIPNLVSPYFATGRYLWYRSLVLQVGISTVILAMLLRRLFEDRRERQRLAGEIEAASIVQRLLLRDAELREPGLTFDAAYQPATEVGGDFYSVLDGQVVISGDVSGKGLKAAMLVSLLIGVLRDTAERQPAAVLRALNRAIAGQTEGGFVTCCCIRLNPGGRVTAASAGHPSPYLDGHEMELEPGLPLGLNGEADWPETEFELAPGSVLTLVSDGVLEAANAQGDLFGFERTRAISNRSTREIAETARAWGQTDDITVVTVRRNPA